MPLVELGSVLEGKLRVETHCRSAANAHIVASVANCSTGAFVGGGIFPSRVSPSSSRRAGNPTNRRDR